MRNIKWFRTSPKIISIHVPKTGGTSFYTMLRESYGVRAKRIQWPEDVATWNKGKLYKANKPFIDVIYGHIQAHPNWLVQYPKAKLITWLRDPADRVISHYYHWIYNGGKGASNNVHYENFENDRPNLVEFAERAEYQSTVKAYEAHLGRIPPEKYGFVGRIEHFDEDLLKLESFLGKRFSRKDGDKNVNVKKPNVSEAMKVEIKSLLKSEYDLYHELLKVGGHK